MQNKEITKKSVQVDRSEAGSIEAGLVLIPTTLFFIILLQIVLVGSWQVMGRAKLHDYVVNESLPQLISHNESAELTFDSTNLGIESKKIETKYGVVNTYKSEQRIPVYGSLLEYLGMDDFRLKLNTIAIE
jgi:hypothetical protein